MDKSELPINLIIIHYFRANMYSNFNCLSDKESPGGVNINLIPNSSKMRITITIPLKNDVHSEKLLLLCFTNYKTYFIE